MVDQNKSIDEVKSPETRAKLDGIQELVTDVDQEILAGRRALATKRVSADAAGSITLIIKGEVERVQAQLNKEEIGAEQARVEIAIINRLAKRIADLASDWAAESHKLEGKLLGLEHANAIASRRFNDTVQKYERHARMEAEDAPLRPVAEPSAPARGKKARKKGK